MSKKLPLQSQWALEYDMQHKSRGRALIFNNRSCPYYPIEKKYSDMDAMNLMQAFTKGAGFEMSNIMLYNNRTSAQILEEIKKVSQEDHTDRDCVVIVLLGYGEHNLVWAHDRPVGIQILLDPLKGDMCHKSLVGKPKIIILQTDNPDQVMAENADAEEEEESATVQVRYVIPTEADFIYLGSEMPGLISGREDKQGSIFISHLAKNIKELGASTEIRRLMTRTLQDVEKEMDSWCSDWAVQNDEMMPYLISLLTKDLKFTEKQKS